MQLYYLLITNVTFKSMTSQVVRRARPLSGHIWPSKGFVMISIYPGQRFCEVDCEVLGTKCLSFVTIECVRLTSSNSQIQNKRATEGFILIRHKRYQIYTCLQLSSSVASFVWKPAHFELRSYGGA